MVYMSNMKYLGPVVSDNNIFEQWILKTYLLHNVTLNIHLQQIRTV